jgi:acetyl-CoA acyltransferase
MREVYILSCVRTAGSRANKGALKDTRPDELASCVIKEAIKRANITPEEVDDVILGCAFPEGPQGMNVARVSLIRAGLPERVPGFTVNRFCASGLEAIAIAGERIALGTADTIIAGGVESMSMIPMGGFNLSPNPFIMNNFPPLYLSMGMTAEKIAERYRIPRKEQDKFALESHLKAWQAIKKGKFKEEIVPVKTKVIREGKIEEIVHTEDEGVRPDTSMEKLSQLKPVFKKDGTVTPGNSCQMSDGAAAVCLSSKPINPLAKYRGYGVEGVHPEIMGIGPVKAIPKVLKLAKLSLPEIGLIELNEAFAAQSLAVIKELGINSEILNVNGGAIALGHPLGCTGAKLTTTLIYEMRRRKVRFGLVSMCIGGGMGAAGIFELV